MIHDPDLLDRLDALPKETFDGEVFRGTRQSLDPLASSYSGGRWMRRDGAGVLYTSLAREGALAEISFHWGQLNPRPTKPVILHTLRVASSSNLEAGPGRPCGVGRSGEQLCRRQHASAHRKSAQRSSSWAATA